MSHHTLIRFVAIFSLAGCAPVPPSDHETTEEAARVTDAASPKVVAVGQDPQRRDRGGAAT